MDRAHRHAEAMTPRPPSAGRPPVAGRLERLQRLAGNRAVSRLVNVQRQEGEVGWFEQRRIWVHEAVAARNWTGENPPGAYWVLNGLALDDIAKVYGMLTSGERGLVAANLDKAVGFDRARIGMGIRRGGDAVQRRQTDQVHWAIRNGRYPAAFELLGQLSDARLDAVLATLDRTHLELLTAHRTETGRAAKVERSHRAVAAALGVRYVPVEGEDIQIDLDVDKEGLQGRFTDPRADRRYIDNAVVAVGVSPMYADGMLVYVAGLDLPILIPGDIVRPGTAPSTASGQTVYPSRAEAQHKAGEGQHAYFEGAGGAVIVPTVISAATAPVVMSTYLVAFNQWLDNVQTTLTLIAIGLAAELVAGVAVNGLARVAGRAFAKPVIKGGSSHGEIIGPPRPQPKVISTARARATPHQLRTVAENAHEFYTFRSPDPDVVANQPLRHTGENTPRSEHAREGVYFARSSDERGYGEFCVTVRQDEVKVVENPADPTELISVDDVPAGTGVWHTWTEYKAARAAAKPK